MGSDAFKRYMQKLGVSLAQKLIPRLAGMPPDDRLEELLRIMNDLGFQTKVVDDPSGGKKTIVASNCVYHDLAKKHQEICEFDRVLISSLLEKDVEHAECMAKGCATCNFKILKGSE
jgi:DeoR family suf operon transcriptional repressor